MSRQLVDQGETLRPSSTGHWFGYEVFATDSAFSLILHISTYDGIRRNSHWATPEVPLEALTKDDAVEEAANTLVAYARTVLGANK